MEEIKDLKAEIHRKQNWIEGIYAKAVSSSPLFFNNWII
jgi:hypothetical protein